MSPTRSESLVVCDECQQALFVNGHPRNFCGHSNRGTLTKYVPLDALLRALNESDDDTTNIGHAYTADFIEELFGEEAASS